MESQGSPRYKRHLQPQQEPSDSSPAYSPRLTIPTDFDLKPPSDADGGSDSKYIGAAANMSFSLFSGFTSTVMTYPLVVFRNQCQVTSRLPNAYHLIPGYCIKPLYHIYKNQGVISLWKGMFNDTMIESSKKVVEIVISENFNLPISTRSENKKKLEISNYMKHFLLKSISTVIMSPFICSAYVLRVQSQLDVDDADYWAVFRDGYSRVIGLFFHSDETSNLVPLYKLIVPVTMLSLGHYIAHLLVSDTMRQSSKRNELQLDLTHHDEIPLIKSLYDRYFPRLMSVFTGRFIADVLMYPLSTITGRLIVQGTRTFLDNVETGNAILTVSSQYTYTGMFDAFKTIYQTEGVAGFYKGFGVLISQYAIQFAVLRTIHVTYEKIMEIHYPRVPRKRIMRSNLSPASSTHSSVTSLNSRM